MTSRKIKHFTVGRPIKYTYKEKLSYLERMVTFIEQEEYPTMPKFCRLNNISKRRIYEWAKDENDNADTKAKYPLGEYFKNCIEKMNDSQELFIEDNTVQGHINTTFAIFKLKQLGWRDSPENVLINSNIIGEDVTRIDERLKALLLDENHS
jgi:hypothetical protein